VTEESQAVQIEIPSANADWESSVVGEPNSEKFPGVIEEPSSEEKGTEVEENSSTRDESCINNESCKVC
jgi:hypothetical protein